ncbi:MAG: DinB family protein [Candidatus Tectomicrobia bacterium]|nr:DinB family protein [Candidatus Tectomicrobia bacterium]
METQTVKASEIFTELPDVIDTYVQTIELFSEADLDRRPDQKGGRSTREMLINAANILKRGAAAAEEYGNVQDQPLDSRLSKAELLSLFKDLQGKLKDRLEKVTLAELKSKNVVLRFGPREFPMSYYDGIMYVNNQAWKDVGQLLRDRRWMNLA